MSFGPFSIAKVHMSNAQSIFCAMVSYGPAFDPTKTAIEAHQVESPEFPSNTQMNMSSDSKPLRGQKFGLSWGASVMRS